MEKPGIGTRVQHSKYGQGIVTGIRFGTYIITFFNEGTHEVDEADQQLDILAAANVTSEIETAAELEKSLLNILRTWNNSSEIVPIGDKWNGGTLLLQPLDKSLKPKEIPIEIFFHKIVMLHDRLRVMEQQINAHAKLSDSDKVNLQQYITRIYGSLTTFNILFKNKEQQFIGEKGKEE